MRSSLRRRLRTAVALALVGVLLAGAWWAQRIARHSASLAYDQALLATAADVALGIHADAGETRFALPPQALRMLQSDLRDRLFFSVRAQDGALVAGEADLPQVAAVSLPVNRSLPGVPASRSTEFRGERVRLLATGFDTGGERFIVTVAETTHKREDMARSILLGMAAPLLAVLAAAVLMVWVVVGRALRPLEALERQLAQRSPADLAPIPLEPVPSEVQPLVSTLNRLLARLDETIRAHQRFVADAAHQIRTPLAVLQTQIDLARGVATGTPIPDPALLSRLHESVARTIRVASQLLALARADPDAPPPTMQPTDLADVVRGCVDDWVVRSLKTDVDLGFELAPAPVVGAPLMLAEMAENLVGNALLYAGRGARVTVTTSRTGTSAELRVEDDGPGIAPVDRDRAFERFERLDRAGGATTGTGLGLAIVREIAARHRGLVTLYTSDMGGLGVSVMLPAADAAP